MEYLPSVEQSSCFFCYFSQYANAFVLSLHPNYPMNLMAEFNINILGCGSALPTTRHLATSQVVDLRDKLYMIDCGEGTQVQMRRMRVRFGRLAHIFISHLHTHNFRPAKPLHDLPGASRRSPLRRCL